jgi:lipid A 3-O-deacylase
MVRGSFVAALGAVSVVAGAGAAHGQEVFAGAAAHDIDLGITACCSEHGVDVQIGARTAPFAHIIGGEVRGYVLGSANTSGGLDFGAVGVALRYPIADDRFYVQGGIGAALTNGSSVKFQATNDRLYLGSRVLFEPEVTVGWRLSHRLALEAAYTHLSHARLAGAQNPGTDSLGLRLTWRIGR